MKVREIEGKSSDKLYSLWKKTNRKRRYTIKRSQEEFIHHYFEKPSTTNRSFLAKEEDRTLGALMLESYNWGSYLYDWIPERDTRVLKNIFEKVVSSFRESESEIYLNPIFSDQDILKYYEKIGFEKDDRAPHHLLMKKEPIQTEKVEKALNIWELHHPNSDEKIKRLADLFIDISTRWDERSEMVKDIRWSLEENVSYLLDVKEDSVIGYCGLEERYLFSGKTIYWIKEVGVAPAERGQGKATAMIKQTLNQIESKDGNEAFIDIHSKNPAKNLYKKLGFQTIEKVPNLRYEF